MRYDTPDLSKEFHPVPKPEGTKKKSTKSLLPGTKTMAWDDARDKLKQIFAKWGITQCEISRVHCWKNNALGFAHIDKRRYLSTEDVKSPNKVVLACTPCHQEVETMPREEMRKILETIIKNREFERG